MKNAVQHNLAVRPRLTHDARRHREDATCTERHLAWYLEASDSEEWYPDEALYHAAKAHFSWVFTFMLVMEWVRRGDEIPLTYQYVDISKRKHGTDTQNEILVLEVEAKCILDADKMFEEVKGVSPARVSDLVTKVPK